MQKRSLSKLFWRTVVSLGAYELVWLSQTRKELMRLTGVRIPKVRWLVLLHGLRLVAAVLVILLVSGMFTSIRQGNHPVVSDACWKQYTLSAAPETVGAHRLTEQCKNAVEAWTQARDREHRLNVYASILFVLLLATSFGYVPWLSKYVAAVQQATGGALSRRLFTFVLTLPPIAGMLALQRVFNNPRNIPAIPAAPITAPFVTSPRVGEKERPIVHGFLSVVAVSMLILLALLLAFIAFVMWR